MRALAVKDPSAHARVGGRAGEGVSRREAIVGGGALAAIVLCGALVVVCAADRPSLLSATTHTGFFPHWMAGPLGGLLPGLTRSSTKLK